MYERDRSTGLVMEIVNKQMEKASPVSWTQVHRDIVVMRDSDPTTENVLQKGLRDTRQGRRREERGSRRLGFRIHAFHCLPNSADNEVGVHRLNVDTRNWVGPHHALDELEQLWARVQVHVRKVFLSETMPSITPTNTTLARDRFILRRLTDQARLCLLLFQASSCPGYKINMSQRSAAERRAAIPKDIGSLAIRPLQDFPRQVHLIALAFEPSQRHAQRTPARHSWPQRRHSKISNLESTVVGQKDVCGFEVQVNHTGLVDKPKTLQKQTRDESHWTMNLTIHSTHVTQVSKYFPYPGFVQSGKRLAILPQETCKVSQLTELGTYEQCLVFFPTIDVHQHVGVTTFHDRSAREMLQHIHLFAQPQPTEDEIRRVDANVES